MVSDYDRIACAIRYIQENVDKQPDLKEVAAHLELSPWHFQRLFQRWAGVTPKRFLEHLTVEKAKKLLRESRSILDTSLQSGLPGPGRLHDHFVSIEAVSPGEYRHHGKGLEISYACHDSPFGTVMLARTARGILALSFVDDAGKDVELDSLKRQWCNARFIEERKDSACLIRRLFYGSSSEPDKLLLSIRGTNFQVRVWNALLSIPAGSVVSYQMIADYLTRPRAVRAVANAVAANPVAYLIPCHRVLRSNGELSGYRWGRERKQLMLGREWLGPAGESPAV